MASPETRPSILAAMIFDVPAPPRWPALGFVAGTMIATSRTASARSRRSPRAIASRHRREASCVLRGIRQRRVDVESAALAGDAWPVRIAAHAFAEGRPTRDLRLAPGSRLRVEFLGEMLVPVSRPRQRGDDRAGRGRATPTITSSTSRFRRGRSRRRPRRRGRMSVGRSRASVPPAYDHGPMIEALRLAARRPARPFPGWTLALDERVRRPAPSRRRRARRHAHGGARRLRDDPGERRATSGSSRKPRRRARCRQPRPAAARRSPGRPVDRRRPVAATRDRARRPAALRRLPRARGEPCAGRRAARACRPRCGRAARGTHSSAFTLARAARCRAGYGPGRHDR